jgi:3-hydroxyisobutyrate dehydrogenase-like beta-hydroxyacid dehydrogenase
MEIKTVAILSPGEMGAATGKAFQQNGFDIITSLEGRSDTSRKRSIAAGFRDCGSITLTLAEADIVFSILPPGEALAQAKRVGTIMKQTGHTPLYFDCNAVAPETAAEIGLVIEAAGASYIDGGIVGNPPGAAVPTRFFVSGSGAQQVNIFDGKGIDIKQCGREAGKASAIKMCYAGITKGTSALHAAMLMAAEKLEIADELHHELIYSQGAMYKRMEVLTPALPAVSDRYIGEMQEIEKTLGSVGMPTGFHSGSADLYRLMDKSPYASEIRETVDKSRTLRQTVEGCAAVIDSKDVTE